MNFEIGQKKCPKLKYWNILWEKYNFVTIIKNYRHITKKIIIKMLR
jgi:hypothetical protein